MSDKTMRNLEIIIIIALFLGGLFFKVLPEYKKSLGSSDAYIDLSNYDDLVEIYIDNKPNFIIVTKKDIIKGILFFDKESLCLYNQNIENSKIEDGITIIVEQLIKYNHLKSTSTITFVKYNDKSYQKVRNMPPYWWHSLVSNNICEFPKGYSFSDPDIHYMLSLKSVFHWKISKDDKLHDTYRNQSQQNTLLFVVCYNSCRPSSNTNEPLFRRYLLVQ